MIKGPVLKTTTERDKHYYESIKRPTYPKTICTGENLKDYKEKCCKTDPQRPGEYNCRPNN